MDQERNITASGVVVDAAGLVMIPANTVNVPARFGGEIKVTPSSIRVIFPGDETEYDAILGAMDSKLGLAYVLVRDLKGRSINAVDMAQVAEPAALEPDRRNQLAGRSAQDGGQVVRPEARQPVARDRGGAVEVDV